MPKLSDLGEREVIRRVRRLLKRPGILTQLDEDAEIFKTKGFLAVTTELHVAGTHFRSSSPVSVGKRVVVSTLTDLLAKGALPLYFMTSIGLSSDTDYEFVRKLYKSMSDSLKEFNAFLIGGDTVESNQLVIGTTAIGRVKGKPLLRKNARVGDKVVVTGEIGNGALGYLLLKKGLAGPRKFVRAQLEPSVDFRLCKRLMSRANAGIDISDGLAFQLAEVAKQSEKRITIFEDELPVDSHLPKLCKENNFNLDEVLFHIGDDYQVLYTMPNPPKGALVIGEVERGSGLFIKRKTGEIQPLNGEGWESFKRH
ncbi:MAG: thiamine-phosphate kinase [Candidatus Diapherotrites archaeon]|nr:thiamine-phosphate kinase [Candidatus Diapherotrites archaeon]